MQLKGHARICLGFVVLLATCCRGTSAESPAGDSPDSLSILEAEMLDAEVLFFRGEYEKVLQRCKNAYKEIDRQRNTKSLVIREGDPLLLESEVDILLAETRIAQGYLAAAQTRLTKARKNLESRAGYWIKRGATFNQLKPFNFRIGYIDICLGEAKLRNAVIESIIQGKDVGIAQCKPYFEEGIQCVKQTFAMTDSEGLEVQLRLLNLCDLRMAQMFSLNGEIDRAWSYLRDAEKNLRSDLAWARQFHPDGEKGVAAPVVASKQGKPVSAPSPPSQATSVSGSNAPRKAIYMDREGTNLEASTQARHETRIAVFYVDLLNVRAELAAADKNPRLAEEAASLARDIAEERFPGSLIWMDTLVRLANAYCDCFEHAMEESQKHKDDVYEFDGEVFNIHAKAAETYLSDVDDLTQRATAASADVNAANPIHFKILGVERKLAAYSKDHQAIDRVEKKCRQLAEARKEDKPAMP